MIGRKLTRAFRVLSFAENDSRILWLDSLVIYLVSWSISRLVSSLVVLGNLIS
jgi:hypothetical protein